MSYLKQSVLGLIALLSLIWLGHQISLLTKHHDTSGLAQRGLDSVLSNVHWIEFNEQGDISQEFYSPQVISDAIQNCYHIQNPLLKLNQNDELWEIKSLKADALQNTETIELIEHVRIRHTNPKKNMVSEMKTEHLHYHPKQKTADTSDKVTINMGENVLHSQGLEASFDENKKIKLGSVTGKYHPEEKSEG